MPFRDSFEDFKFSYVSRDPDIVEADKDIFYIDPHTNLFWFAPSGPSGRCDGQSVPRFAWPIAGHPLEGTGIRPAFLHDYGYKTGDRPKREVDAMYLHALREEGNDSAYIKYISVKLGGFVAWWRHRRREKRTANL